MDAKKLHKNLGIFISILIVSGFVHSCASANDEREPNKLEWCYRDLAIQLKDPSLCEKISPMAVYSAPFSPGDSQIYFWRSICFYDVARATRNPQLCQYVKPYSTPFLNGSGISESGCRKDIEKPYSTTGCDCDEEMLLSTLGYNATDMPSGIKKEGYPYYFLHNPDIGAKLSSLPDFSNPGTNIAFRDVGCEITAPYERYKCYTEKLLKDNDPGVCEQIDRQSNKIICRALFNKDPGTCEQISASPGFTLDRDNCYALIGMHNQDLSVCSKIENWSYKRDCIMGIAILQRNPDLCDTLNGDKHEKKWCRECVSRYMKGKE